MVYFIIHHTILLFSACWNRLQCKYHLICRKCLDWWDFATCASSLFCNFIRKFNPGNVYLQNWAVVGGPVLHFSNSFPTLNKPAASVKPTNCKKMCHWLKITLNLCAEIVQKTILLIFMSHVFEPGSRSSSMVVICVPIVPSWLVKRTEEETDAV